MRASELGEALHAGEAASAMCALASTSILIPDLDTPSASQTGPPLGQKSASGCLGKLSMPRSESAAPSRYSEKFVDASGERHSTVSSSNAPARRSAASIDSGVCA